MFKLTTDYSNYPTVTELSDNDINNLYKRPLSECEIIAKFEEMQEIKLLLTSYIKENETLRSKVIILENKVKNLEEKRTESEQGNSTTNKVAKKKLYLTTGQTYTMGNYGGEKIQWRVLNVEDEKALLISEKGLDTKPYHGTNKKITWAQCDLRQWLNNEFVNKAFSLEEKQRLVMTEVKNVKNSKYGTDGGNDTEDQVFLMSIDEVREYFKTDKERICYPTEYAKKQGAWVKESSGTCGWWLRSPGGDSFHATTVHNLGRVHEDGNFVLYGRNAVRPALCIYL